MVLNSFGIRNFMHPMGSLSMPTKCLDFFLLSFGLEGRGGGGGGGFFLFLLCSLQVPKVPNVLPKGVPNSNLALIPYVLPKVRPFSPT
jgi:hypothetical protein